MNSPICCQQKISSPYTACWFGVVLLLNVLILVGSTLSVHPVHAQSAKPAEQVGVSTGLPIPRYVSLKSGKVNMRQGPGKDHRTIWIYKKAGLPVEVIAEFENWRKIRDWEGTEGWIFHTLLSGRRMAMVTPWSKKGLQKIYSKASEGSALAARLGPRVIAKVRSCDKTWCRITGDKYDGYIKQKSLWGVYPNEVLE